MPGKCLETVYLAVLVASVLISLGGYVTPYWQIDEIPQPSGEVIEVYINLNYACANYHLQNGNKTLCEVLRFFYTSSLQGTPSATMFVVRTLLTLHVGFMIISVALNLSSMSCLDRPRKKRIFTRVISMFCSLFGVAGLSAFAGASTRYRSPFDGLILPEDIDRIKPSDLHLSFYLCCAGGILFTVFTSAELLLSLKKRQRGRSGSDTTKLHANDAFSYVSDTPRHLQDPDSAHHNNSSSWSLVESCHVEIFRNLFTRRY